VASQETLETMRWLQRMGYIRATGEVRPALDGSGELRPVFVRVPEEELSEAQRAYLRVLERPE
jgi:hypothetical protein